MTALETVRPTVSSAFMPLVGTGSAFVALVGIGLIMGVTGVMSAMM